MQPTMQPTSASQESPPASQADPEMKARHLAIRQTALENRANIEGLLAMSFEEAKVSRSIAYKAEVDRRVAIKECKRKLGQAMKDRKLDLRAAMREAEDLNMYEDPHYKLAAERVMGLQNVSADNLTLEKWMFINIPATDRRVLRFFRMEWNANVIRFFFERDETGETAIAIHCKDASGKAVFAQCYLLSLTEKGTTAGGHTRGGWDTSEGPESEGIESGVEGGEDWEEGVLRIIDANDKVWDLTAVRDNSPAWLARVKELECNASHRRSALKTWKGWIEASLDACKEEQIEAERQRLMSLGCYAGPPIAQLMAYRGPHPGNWNKSCLETHADGGIREDVLADKTLTRLFLEHNTLSCFPTNMRNMTALTELWIGHNRIESADDQVLKKLAKRTPLSFLSLDCNCLEEIPPAVGDFSQLQELRLSANGLKLIPPSSIARNCLLTTLWLQNNRLSSLPADMGVTLSNLTSLFLNNNQLSRLPQSVAGWTGLVELRAHENCLEALPVDTRRMCSLRCMNVAFNKIAELPHGLDALTSLEELYLGHNLIGDMKLPDGGLVRMPVLHTLHLESNRLLEVPVDEDAERHARRPDSAHSIPTIVGLTALTELRLDCNGILFVPKDVGYMTHLHSLKLSYNRIHFLPVELGELMMLKEISLQCNPVLELQPQLAHFANDAQAVVGYLKGEKTQTLTNMRLEKVPSHVIDRRLLQDLFLSHNHITLLPPDLHVLQALRTLHVDHNELRLLEPWIGQLTALSDLALNNNRLLSLPGQLGCLSALTFLSLQHNMLTNLPPQLGLCSRLQTLLVEHNPLRPPFSDASEEGGMQGVLDLMFEMAGDCAPPTRPASRQ